MKLSKSNEWLSFGANLGVLAGIIFLILEIQQSNRIAEGNASAEVMSRSMVMNSSIYENPEVAALAAKLASGETELDPTEIQQARFLAFNKTNLWGSAYWAHQNGLISNEQYQSFKNDIGDNFKMFPGLVPHWDYIRDLQGLQLGDFDIMDEMIRQLAERGY